MSNETTNSKQPTSQKPTTLPKDKPTPIKPDPDLVSYVEKGQKPSKEGKKIKR